MTTLLLALILVLLIILLVIQLGRGRGESSASEVLEKTMGQRLELLQSSQHQLQALQGQLHNTLSQELAANRSEGATQSREGRTELLGLLEVMGKAQTERLKAFSDELAKLTGSNEAKLEGIRLTVEGKLKELREDNGLRLEEMRRTVDEKLQTTLEKRLGESFQLVSERLEKVHQGLGEMQNLAAGVGDLKKVLTNVKTRGNWGEVQLGALLEQMLTPSQYERNVCPNPASREVVEFAIKLPGKGEGEAPVWLPVDAKFFVEDYKRLHEAQERADLAAIEESTKALRDAVLKCAKDISTKYLNPPATTDFGIMFVPTEGLFAELLRIPGVVEELQGKHRVVLAGPTTFAALLNSLQMGFRTLTIQKQSSEVWQTLGLVKTEFSKFGDSLEAVKKSLQAATNKIEQVGTRSRAVERSLRKVEELPGSLPADPLGEMLGLDDSAAEEEIRSGTSARP
jgi:DNA recombination protein RmuC